MKKKTKIIVILVLLGLLFLSFYFVLNYTDDEWDVVYTISFEDFIENKDIPCLIRGVSYPCENKEQVQMVSMRDKKC